MIRKRKGRAAIGRPPFFLGVSRVRFVGATDSRAGAQAAWLAASSVMRA
jgi:hypothetical protein